MQRRLLRFAVRLPECSLGGFSAIDRNDLTSNKRSLVGGEINDGFRDLLRRSCALERNVRDHRGLSVGVAGEAVQHPGFDRAGRDCVDADAEGCPFEGRRLRQSFDGVLAGGIDRGARRGLWPIVDERLMMLPCPWLCITRSSCFMLSTVPRTLVSNVAA